MFLIKREVKEETKHLDVDKINELKDKIDEAYYRLDTMLTKYDKELIIIFSTPSYMHECLDKTFKSIIKNEGKIYKKKDFCDVTWVDDDGEEHLIHMNDKAIVRQEKMPNGDLVIWYEIDNKGKKSSWSLRIEANRWIQRNYSKKVLVNTLSKEDLEEVKYTVNIIKYLKSERYKLLGE